MGAVLGRDSLSSARTAEAAVVAGQVGRCAVDAARRGIAPGGSMAEKAFSKLCSHLCLIGQCVPGMPITGKMVYRVSTANAGY